MGWWHDKMPGGAQSCRLWTALYGTSILIRSFTQDE